MVKCLALFLDQQDKADTLISLESGQNFLLKEHGIMVVGFNIEGLWSHKKSRQIGSCGLLCHCHVWLSWWGVWSLLPGSAVTFLNLMEIWNSISERQVQSILPPQRADLWHQITSTWIGLSVTSSPTGLVFPSCLHTVSPFHSSEHYSAYKQMD